MYKALSVLFSGPDRLDKVWISELHLLGTQLFSLLKYLRRQIAQDTVNPSKNVGGVFFCRVCQIMRITMFAGLASSQACPNCQRELNFLTAVVTVLLISVKFKLLQLSVHLTIYSAGISLTPKVWPFWLKQLPSRNKFIPWLFTFASIIVFSGLVCIIGGAGSQAYC